jgi:hypothetical protein
VVVLFALLIAGGLSGSMRQVEASQATQVAALSAVPAFALPPSMATALVPCAAEVTGPCDLIATKAEDIAGVWKQYLSGPDLDPLGGTAYMHYHADGTFILTDSVENTVKIYRAGTFTFDGPQLVFAAITQAPAPCNGPGVFQIRVLKYDDKPVALRYVAISDTCTGRLQDVSQAAVWVAANSK